MDPIRFVVSPAAHSRMNQKDRALSALPLLQFVISCLGGRGGGGEGKEREGGWEEGEKKGECRRGKKKGGRETRGGIEDSGTHHMTNENWVTETFMLKSLRNHSLLWLVPG